LKEAREKIEYLSNKNRRLERELMDALLEEALTFSGKVVRVMKKWPPAGPANSSVFLALP